MKYKVKRFGTAGKVLGSASAIVGGLKGAKWGSIAGAGLGLGKELLKENPEGETTKQKVKRVLKGTAKTGLKGAAIGGGTGALIGGSAGVAVGNRIDRAASSPSWSGGATPRTKI
jgi:hypothetical protein